MNDEIIRIRKKLQFILAIYVHMYIKVENKEIDLKED